MVVGQDQNAVHGRDAEQCYEADRGRHAERRAADPQRENAAQQRHGDHTRRQQRIAQAAEVQIKQQHDQRQRERHGYAEARDGFLQIAEFADPLETVPARQQH